VATAMPTPDPWLVQCHQKRSALDFNNERGTRPWQKLDLKAVGQTVARSALSTMALKNGSGQRIAAKRSVTAV